MNNIRHYITSFFFIFLLPTMSISQEKIEKKPLIIKPAFEVLSKYTNVRDFTMSSEGNEAYVSIQSPLGEISAIAVLKKKNGKWEEPKLASFSGEYTDLEPFLAPDDLKLYFVSNRPIDAKSKDKKDMDIWFVERKNKKAKWSTPKNIGSPINTKGNEFYPAVAANGNLYFTLVSKNSKGADDIFFSEWKNGKYSEPISLDESINSKGAEYNSYIAPDESFIMFGGWRRKDSMGSGDIYISFRKSDGTWKKAVNLGNEINSRYMEYCPFVDWKTKTLYFTSRRSAIKAKGFSSLRDFEKETKKYENGRSRIYKAQFDLKLLELKSKY